MTGCHGDPFALADATRKSYRLDAMSWLDSDCGPRAVDRELSSVAPRV